VDQLRDAVEKNDEEKACDLADQLATTEFKVPSVPQENVQQNILYKALKKNFTFPEEVYNLARRAGTLGIEGYISSLEESK